MLRYTNAVGHTGFEPVTSALSRQRSKPTELISLYFQKYLTRENNLRHTILLIDNLLPQLIK